ncbi:MAG: short-chain dehydrogenase [Methylomonas sp.]|nr:MAG: short-chain dehydrogenase [Methylomonas sp.]PPD25494.1 MAG: short-chain dehydrogenase [Methylomonas sp.]PPD36290.1 MAG: short-chain dehydrogenase [Methylomonas sp.]PPD42415.1 MAG: short-chain dehydrogenase [Methylomonas sp.]PPD53125.1 MAG: short-chain dehydrogenase [Methylomonas sp.]
MTTLLITGANRGLGLEFCRQYAERGDTVIATCREPERADALQALAQKHTTLSIEKLDVADFAQIDQLAQRLAGRAIDVLLNNAGVYSDMSGGGLGRLNYGDWMRSLTINALAPVKMAEALLPQLQISQRKLIVSVSSLMGSIADNGSGGSLFYRTSKSALNSAMKTLAIDLQPQGIGVLILHPGWVRTDMGGENALIGVEESVSGMTQRIAGFDMTQTGRFVKYDGKALPW